MSLRSWDTQSDNGSIPSSVGGRHDTPSVHNRFVSEYCRSSGFDPLTEPVAMRAVSQFLVEPLPPHWVVRYTAQDSEYGPDIPYYTESQTRESQWAHPQEARCLQEVGRLLIEQPQQGSAIWPYWNLHRIESDALSNDTGMPPRPIISDSPASPKGTANDGRIVIVSLKGGFPIVNVGVIDAFAKYFGVNVTGLSGTQWVLGVASVCPVPPDWTFRCADITALFVKTDGSSASKLHPFDMFFSHLLKEHRILFPGASACGSDRCLSLIPIDSTVRAPLYYDWSRREVLSQQAVLAKADVLLGTLDPTCSEEKLMHQIQSAASLLEALRSRAPDLNPEVAAALHVLNVSVGLLTRSPRILEIIEDLSFLRTIDKGTQTQLRGVLATGRCTLSEGIRMLSGTLRDLLASCTNFDDFSTVLLVTERLLEVSIALMDELSHHDQALVVKVLRKLSKIVTRSEEASMPAGGILTDYLINQIESSMGIPSPPRPVETRRRVLRIIRGITVQQLTMLTTRQDDDALSVASSLGNDVEDPEPLTIYQQSIFSDLANLYVPGAPIVTAGVLQQMSRSNVRLSIALLDGLGDAFNALLVDRLNERDRVFGEVTTKRASIELISGHGSPY